MPRTAEISRTTKETSVRVSLNLDGSGQSTISTGIPFYDHMLDQLARHGSFDLVVDAVGDLDVDGHHTVEDVAIVIGECFKAALGDKTGVRRFASGLYPLDEALVEVALDLSGRPFCVVSLGIDTSLALGQPPFNPEMTSHIFDSFATAAGITLHVNRKAGVNTHHIIEASFKGLARCLRDAVRIESDQLPSTKGVL